MFTKLRFRVQMIDGQLNYLLWSVKCMLGKIEIDIFNMYLTEILMDVMEYNRIATYSKFRAC